MKYVLVTNIVQILVMNTTFLRFHPNISLSSVERFGVNGPLVWRYRKITISVTRLIFFCALYITDGELVMTKNAIERY